MDPVELSSHSNFLTFSFFQVQTIIPRIVLGKGQIVSDKTRDKNVRENLRCEI